MSQLYLWGVADKLHRDPAEVARRLARWASLTVPVNPFELAQRLGVDVHLAPLRGLDGLLRRDQYGDWYIIVSSLLGEARRRFTCAHEIGHYVLHRHRRREVFTKSPCKRGLWEREANQFAAALLMPEEQLQQLRLDLDPPDPDRLAKKYRVSRQAMTIRLEQLGLMAAPPVEPWINF